MKTTMKQLAAGTFIALLLMVGNVYAEGTERMALISESIETTLQVEEWMTDESIWNTEPTGFVEIAQETESGLELENWMISNKMWDKNRNVEDTEIEAELTVENWMINDIVWNK